MNFTLTIFAQAIAFALFIWFTVAFVWPPLLSAIEKRQKQIADGLAEAERGRSSLADAQKKTEGLLREARDRAHELMAQAEKTANQRVEEAKVQAKVEADRIVAAGNSQQLAAWWLHRMRSTPDPLLEKLTLFWHGHFATGENKVRDYRMMFRQNAMFRGQAAG